LTDLRQLVGIIQKHPDVTNEIRADLKIPLRSNGPSPKPAPSKIPTVTVKKVHGTNITVGVNDPDDLRRAIVKGALGFSCTRRPGGAGVADVGGSRACGYEELPFPNTTMTVSAANGIVAAGDGASWAGVSELALPFP
jgi:hypothetical protein